MAQLEPVMSSKQTSSPFTPNGYIVPVEFCNYFLLRMKDVSKSTKMHLKEYGLTKSKFCKGHIYLKQPPISWKIWLFVVICNMEVRVNVTARLYTDHKK